MMTAQNLSEAQRREDDDGVDDAKEQQQQQQQQQRRRDEEGARTKENGSNALDIKRTEELDSLLRLEDVYESASECTRREEVLGELNEMLQDWIRTRSLSKGHPDRTNQFGNGVGVAPFNQGFFSGFVGVVGMFQDIS